jgi:hypothetical protein
MWLWLIMYTAFLYMRIGWLRGLLWMLLSCEPYITK